MTKNTLICRALLLSGGTTVAAFIASARRDASHRHAPSRPWPSEPGWYPLAVDHRRSIEEMKAAANFFNRYTETEVTSAHFPPDPTIAGSTEFIEVKLLQFDGPRRTAEVLRAMDEQDLRPATMAELLTFYGTYPGAPGRLVALGSPCRRSGGMVGYGCLSAGPDQRRVTVRWVAPGVSDSWHASSEYLAVRRHS